MEAVICLNNSKINAKLLPDAEQILDLKKKVEYIFFVSSLISLLLHTRQRVERGDDNKQQ